MLDPLELKFSDGCEPTRGCWESNPGPLQEQQVLLAAKPTAQPIVFNLWAVYFNNVHKEPLERHMVLLFFYLVRVVIQLHKLYLGTGNMPLSTVYVSLIKRVL